MICDWSTTTVVVSTDEVVYHNFNELLEFVIGDVRDYHSVASVLRDADVVFNAAALKQVPTCEYFPSKPYAPISADPRISSAPFARTTCRRHRRRRLDR